MYLAALLYPSHFWAQHLLHRADVDDMTSFKLLCLLFNCFLQWLDVMNAIDTFQAPLAAVDSKVSLSLNHSVTSPPIFPLDCITSAMILLPSFITPNFSPPSLPHQVLHTFTPVRLHLHQRLPSYMASAGTFLRPLYCGEAE